MSVVFKAPSNTTPRVGGLQVPQSLYGQAIPYIFGHCRCSHKLIYWSNFQSHQQGGKKGGGKGGGQQVTYTVNADMLLGYGPMEGIGSVWQNQTWFYVNYGSQSFVGVGTSNLFTFTITSNASTLVMVMGVQLEVSYSVTYNDYAGPQLTRSFGSSGTSFLPLNNGWFVRPNYNAWNAGAPYARYNTTMGDANVQVFFPSPVTAPVVTVFYCENGGSDAPPNSNSQGKKAGGGIPIQQPGLTFESFLGAGPSGNPQVFSEFSGVGGAAIPLSSSPTIPAFNYEVKGLFGMGNAEPVASFNPATSGYTPASTAGSCNPIDILVDLICSGNSDINITKVWHHGLGFSSQQAGATLHIEYSYSRYGGILKNETNPLQSRAWAYCMAYNIFISGSTDSSKTAASFFDDICKVANCAPCWDGASLDFIPYCEISAYGNGISYVSATAAGPVFNLDDRHMLEMEDKAPLVAVLQRAENNFNSMQIGYSDAQQQFNQNFLVVSDTMDIQMQGAMPGSQQNFDFVTNFNVAQTVGNALLHRALTVERHEYHISLPAYWECILTQMDLITVLDATLSDQPIPVRIKTIEIAVDDKGKRKMDVVAEPFLYGASAPLTAIATGAPQTNNSTAAGQGTPGDVNAPIFIETVPQLNTAGPQIWISVSGAGASYGGCAIWMSLDGGATYQPTPVAIVAGRQTNGLVYSSNYPSHADPDNVNTLHVDLTQSKGVLTGVSATAQNNFQSLWYLAGGGNVTLPNGTVLTIPYELGAFQAAGLAAANQYNLTQPNRRGVYNTPISAHNIGTPFSYLNDGIIARIPLTKSMIGVTLYFKFTSFNTQQNNQQALSDVSPYTFTPTGLVGWSYDVAGGGGTETTATVEIAGPLFISFWEGDGIRPNANEMLLEYVVPGNPSVAGILLKTGLPGSEARCQFAPQSNVSVGILQNNVSVGTIRYVPNSTVGSFIFPADITVLEGDVWTWPYQATPDASIAGLFWTISGIRST